MKAECPVCESKDSKLLESTENPFVQGEILQLFYCEKCVTLFYYPFPSANYTETETFGIAEDKFYLEYQAGLLFMLSLLYPLRHLQSSNMLEIGCGLGFLLDMGKEMLHLKDVIGIEPSYANRMKLFDYHIMGGYFPEVLSQNTQKYDLIAACEVLEHTHEPKKFLETIISFLADKGVAVITTPNASAYFGETEGERFGMKSAGAHTVIFSTKSLGKVLEDLGTHFRIFTSEGTSGKAQAIIFVSNDKGTLETIDYKVPSSIEVLGFTEDYYEKKIKKLRGQFTEDTKKWFFFGLIARLIDVRVNRGLYGECEPFIEGMVNGLLRFYAVDIGNMDSFIMNLEELFIDREKDRGRSFLTNYPNFLARFLYFYGIWLLNYKRKYVQAYEMFSYSHRLSQLEDSLPEPWFYANMGIMKLSKMHLFVSISKELQKIGYPLAGVLLKALPFFDKLTGRFSFKRSKRAVNYNTYHKRLLNDKIF